MKDSAEVASRQASVAEQALAHLREAHEELKMAATRMHDTNSCAQERESLKAANEVFRSLFCRRSQCS